MKRIQITKKIGSAEVGEIYVQGLHGIPNGRWQESDAGHKPEDFFWLEGTTQEDNAFLFRSWIWGEQEDENGEMQKWSYAKYI